MTRPSVERLSLDGPAGSLEILMEDPGPTLGAGRSRYALICHPHPLLGGTMDNKVVVTLARAFHELGIPTLRFNFRGVGASSGVFDAGIGETGDARAVADWGAVRWPGRELAIAGFSFGAYVALRLAQTLRASNLVTVAPPLGRFDFTGLEVPDCPWLVLQGDADEVVDPQTVIGWAGGLTPRPHLMVMPGVGHFFHGSLNQLKDAVIDAVREN